MLLIIVTEVSFLVLEVSLVSQLIPYIVLVSWGSLVKETHMAIISPLVSLIKN